MFVLNLVLKNTLRHKLRTVLTIFGIAIAVAAFGFIRTIVTAWSAGVEASAQNRMITRHAVSFILPLPYSYLDRIANVPGVSAASFANWFGGVYKDAADFKNFFPRIAVESDTYFDLYPEFIISPDQLALFKAERNACIVGAKLAAEQGFALGDVIPIEGDIFPGRWEFTVRGIYRGRDRTTDETQMFFHWKYLNERIREMQPAREGMVGWYVIQVDRPDDMPRVGGEIDGMFENSRARTKTETEREFQQSFVSMSSSIITSLKAASYLIVGIILLVLANTIVMSARERMREYAVLKTIGFSGIHIVGLIGGESMVIAILGGAIGLALTFPAAGALAAAFPTFFPIVNVEPLTIIIAAGVSLAAGLVAAMFPAMRALRMNTADGLRSVG